jgi:hypothetical protein
MSQFRGFIAVDIDVFPKLLEFEKEIKETDKTIDQMVYELYGLTGEEIAIVEESMAS